MEDRGLDVVDVYGVVDDVEAQLVGRAQGEAGLDAAAGEPHGEGLRVVVAAELAAERGVRLDHRRPAELAAPDHQRVVEQPALLEVAHQGGTGAVGLAALRLQTPLDVGVVVPPLVVELHEPYPALDQASRQQAVRGERRHPRLDAIIHQRPGRLLLEVHQLGGARLHAVGHLVGVDAGGDLGIADGAEMGRVQVAHQVERIALEPRVDARRAGHVQDRVALGPEHDPLIRARQEPVRPVGRAAADARAARHHDETRQVVGLASQAVRDPRAHARPTRQGGAGVEEDLRGGVVKLVGRDRPDDRDVVDHPRQVRDHARQLGAALPVAGERESRGEQAGVGPDEGVPLVLHDLGRDRPAVILDQGWLAVEEVELAGRAGHEQEDHPLRLRGKVRGLRRHRVSTGPRLRGRTRQQRGQRDLADTDPAVAEEVATGHVEGRGQGGLSHVEVSRRRGGTGRTPAILTHSRATETTPGLTAIAAA